MHHSALGTPLITMSSKPLGMYAAARCFLPRIARSQCRRFSTKSVIAELLAPDAPQNTDVMINGWVRTARLQKSYSFLSVNDGSSPSNMQIVWKSSDPVVSGIDGTSKLTTGASVQVTGKLVKSPKPAQPVELHASTVRVVGECDADKFPLQKKAHTPEFLRDMIHLRARTPTIASMLRVRAALMQGIHKFFEREGFHWISTPILTANDCEGAGELFRVAANSSVTSPQSNNFFGKPVYLTVSGQLHLETFATALSKVYTFGPTFRAENSNTPRHLAEFWMLEPEIAPGTMDDAMNLAESCVKKTVHYMADARKDDVKFFTEKQNTLSNRLEKLFSSSSFPRITYKEAIQLLQKSPQQFSIPVVPGDGLASEHEKYLAEQVFSSPVFVYNYPAAIKPFYMKRNTEDDTVQAFDLLVPGLGELVGGSAREDNFEVLGRSMAKNGLLSPTMKHAIETGRDEELAAADCDEPYLDWYLDLRRFGNVPHAGWGLGFERLVLYCTGLDNIRDAIPIPRVPGSCRL